MELFTKLLLFSPPYNGKIHFEGNDGCTTYELRFSTKHVSKNYPYYKRKQQKTVFLEVKQFCLFMTQSISYEKKGRISNLKYIEVWGCLATFQVPIPKKIEIGPKTVDYKIRLE